MHAQLDVIADMLGPKFLQVEAMLRDAADDLLALTVFQLGHWKTIWSTNPLVAASVGFGSYETAWAWMHKLRRAMVRPDREQLSGDVELDEVFVGTRATGRPGAGTAKLPIMVAVERRGRGQLGRMQVADRPNTGAILDFAHDVIAHGSTVYADGTRLSSSWPPWASSTNTSPATSSKTPTPSCPAFTWSHPCASDG